MTCPDWNRLAADRLGSDAEDVREPEGWREALEHLDGCDGCRSDALAADPVLLFRRMPAVEVDAGTLEDVRAGVAALRRAQRLTGGAERSRDDRGRRAPWRWWGRAAAAMVLAAGLLGLKPGVGGPDRAAVAFSDTAPAPVARIGAAAAFTLDDIDHPTASVYHFDDEEIGVVMVVDAGLDV